MGTIFTVAVDGGQPERLLDGVKEEIASFKDLSLGRRDRRRPGP